MISSPLPISQAAGVAARGRILIVDDNPANLGVLFDCLDHAGFEVLVAQDGESALQKANYSPPDLILLDVMMPGIDGFETCRRLQASVSTAAIPVIFMTALADSADKVTGLSIGAVDYITKPFQQDEVLARIDIHLRLRHLSETLAAKNSQLEQEVCDRKAAEAALQSANDILEIKVAERTAELQQAVARLESTLQALQQAQVQMVQAEKMASLGQLVAGVAHEINNPVNFIHGNLAHAKGYIDDLMAVLGLYRQHCPQPGPEVEQCIEQLDLDFITEDLPNLLRSMKVGADRIRSIVVALRTFSRMDEAECKAVDIHEGIDSTLMILQHRIKSTSERVKIEVVKDYGSLPPTECYAGQLNQVFMNVLSNAIDALEDAAEARTHADWQPCITIRTALTEGQVVIAIADNGIGMTAAVCDRIFDPFFTTKPVGKGTGMGLSISYQIVAEKHRGSLTCRSQLGQGTEFTIAIPA